MMFTIRRLLELKDATLGLLINGNGNIVCQTAELPWKDNKPFISCVPPGIYQAIRVMSPSRGIEVYQLVDVPGRTVIQMHIANAPMRPINAEGDTELLGCIAPGLTYGQRDGYNGVMSSRVAFTNFMAITKGEKTITLRIENNF